MVKVRKRDGSVASFDKKKIIVAIEKAMRNGSGMFDSEISQDIADKIEKAVKGSVEIIEISNIEDMIFIYLIDAGHRFTAKAYEGYRRVREEQRCKNEVDNKVLGIVNGKNKDVLTENSNKNALIHSTQRDLIAGEISKDIARRKLFPPHIIQAHDEGIIHLHDLDYSVQSMFNCCLGNLDDMLQNGTVINEKLIEKPKSFSTACTIATQIIQQIANGQFGKLELPN